MHVGSKASIQPGVFPLKPTTRHVWEEKSHRSHVDSFEIETSITPRTSPVRHVRNLKELHSFYTSYASNERPVFALLIISKAGSLIYHRTFPTSTPAPANSSTPQPQTGTLGLPGTTTLTTNDYLVLAGTFHGVHAITRSLTPKIPTNSSSFTSANSNVSQQRDSTSNNTLSPPARMSQSSSVPLYTYPDPSQPATGIESLETSFFRLAVFQTITGTKFLLFTDPSMPNTDVIMKGVYERFADFVCKNPFWQMEMPIRIESWEREIGKWLGRR